MDYRREIDGLRALAVIPVMLYHAGFQSFKGGFVGVDVFFVISGYLITSLILAEKQAGTFTIMGFYERRARRILPALFLVMLISLPCAWMTLMPSDMKDFSKSVVAVSTFASNILFWRQSGYFDTAAELKPLLHTWSLAVEEQYYLLFPVFLLLAWKFGKRWIIGILFVVALISLALAQWGAFNKPDATFLLLPTRGWELLIGVFVAFYLFTKESGTTKTKPSTLVRLLINQSVSVIGVLLIVYAVCVFDKSTPFPSVYALIPTIGTALVILCTTQQTVVGRFLGYKLFVGIGLISYSAYLWHHPIFSFARHLSIDQLSSYKLIALILASFLLAFLSWKFVETPFRDRKKIRGKNVFGFGVLGFTVFCCFGFFGIVDGGFQCRLDPDLLQYYAPEKTNEEDGGCVFSTIGDNENIKLCYFGDTNSDFSIALYGDSHAGALFSVLDREFREKKIKGIRTYIEGCKVIPEILTESSNVEYMKKTLDVCKSSFKELVSYLDMNTDGIVIGVRWTFGLYPINGLIDEQPFDNGEGGKEISGELNYSVTLNRNNDFTYDGSGKENAIRTLLYAFVSLNKPVLLIYPVPEVGWNVPRMNYKRFLHGRAVITSDISTSYERFKVRNQFTIDALDRITDSNIIRIKPESKLCNTYIKDRCATQFNGVPFYYDEDHLSNAGARLVVDEIMKKMMDAAALVNVTLLH